MKDLFKYKTALRHLLSLICLFVGFSVNSASAQIVTEPPIDSGYGVDNGSSYYDISMFTITCTDSSNPDTCTIDGDGSSLGLIDFTIEVFNTISTQQGCTETFQGSGIYDCPLGAGETSAGLDFTCALSTDLSFDYGTCDITDIPGAFNMDCQVEVEGSGGSCIASSNPKQFTNLLDTAFEGKLPKNILSIADSLLSCSARNNFDEFQAICDNIISLLQPSNSNYDPESALQLIDGSQPLNPDASTDTSIAITKEGMNNISDRLSNIRQGINPSLSSTSKQYFDGLQWSESGTLLAQDDTISNDASPVQTADVSGSISDYGRLGFFINVSLIDAELDDSGNELGNDSSSSILTLGLDYRVTDNYVAGIAYNIGFTETDYGNRGQLDSTNYSVLLFNSYYKDNWFVDGAITFGADEYEQDRNFTCLPPVCGPTAVKETFASTFHGSQLTYSISGGYEWQIDSFRIAPYAQVVNGNIETDSYKERATKNQGTPVSTFALQLNEQDRDLSTLYIGSNFQYIVNTEKGVFIPTVILKLVKELEDEAQTVTGRFIANASPNSAFSLETNEIESSYLIFGAGFSFQLKNGNAGFLTLETVEGYEDLEQQRLTAGWRWEI